MSMTRGRQARARQLARDNVKAMLVASLSDTDSELYVGIEGMDRDELDVFRSEVRRIVARVKPGPKVTGNG